MGTPSAVADRGDDGNGDHDSNEGHGLQKDTQRGVAGLLGGLGRVEVQRHKVRAPVPEGVGQVLVLHPARARSVGQKGACGPMGRKGACEKGPATASRPYGRGANSHRARVQCAQWAGE
jgi:hypothetical protein